MYLVLYQESLDWVVGHGLGGVAGGASRPMWWGAPVLGDNPYCCPRGDIGNDGEFRVAGRV